MKRNQKSSIFFCTFSSRSLRKASLNWNQTIGVEDPNENFLILASFVGGEFLKKKFDSHVPTPTRDDDDGDDRKDEGKYAYHRVETFSFLF